MDVVVVGAVAALFSHLSWLSPLSPTLPAFGFVATMMEKAWLAIQPS